MAIKTELHPMVDGVTLVRTYSDAGKYIQRDGVTYAEAIDPASLGREYTETDEDIPTTDKFTPTESEDGGDGSESNPYTFVAGKKCVLNAYYTTTVKYVYMPADAEAKAYDSWEAAEADFAIWDEGTTETSETA